MNTGPDSGAAIVAYINYRLESLSTHLFNDLQGAPMTEDVIEGVENELNVEIQRIIDTLIKPRNKWVDVLGSLTPRVNVSKSITGPCVLDITPNYDLITFLDNLESIKETR